MRIVSLLVIICVVFGQAAPAPTATQAPAAPAATQPPKVLYLSRYINICVLFHEIYICDIWIWSGLWMVYYIILIVYNIRVC